MTLVGEKEEKDNTIQPPFLCFSYLQFVSRALVLLRTLNSVTVQDLRKTCLVNHLFLVLVLIIMLYVIPHFLTSYFLFTRLLNPFYPVIFSTFYSSFFAFYLFISQHFTIFMSQHFICLFCKRFTRLFLSFFPFKFSIFLPTFYLFIFQRFTFIFSLYSSFKTEKFRRFRRNFGREVF